MIFYLPVKIQTQASLPGSNIWLWLNNHIIFFYKDAYNSETSQTDIQLLHARLAYLHEGLEPKVVHRDIKASNILLDQQWNAKVSDFGLAKLLCSEKSYVTTRVMGTFGLVMMRLITYIATQSTAMKLDLIITELLVSLQLCGT